MSDLGSGLGADLDRELWSAQEPASAISSSRTGTAERLASLAQSLSEFSQIACRPVVSCSIVAKLDAAPAVGAPPEALTFDQPRHSPAARRHVLLSRHRSRPRRGRLTRAPLPPS